jgi:hypothetical protein
MPTLEEWLALEHTEETPLMVRLFEQRPEWLATGRLDEEILVWFGSDIPDRPLALDYEEFTLVWDKSHEHLYDLMNCWPPEDPVEAAIQKIEAILAGELVQIYAETPEGQWQRVGFAPLEAIPARKAEYEELGWVVTVTQWPGRKIQ